MKRRLSIITMGVMALFIMLSVPVSAQKLQEKKTADVKQVESTFQRGNFKKSADNGKMRSKAIAQNAVKPSKYSNLLKAAKRMNPMAPFGRPFRIAKADGDVLVPPFTETWDGTYNSMYSIIDANQDTKTWVLGSTYAYCQYNTANAADDWLVSPALQLEGGKQYDFEAAIYCALASYPERVEILFGTGEDPTTYTNYILEATDITKPVSAEDAQPITGKVVPAADGVYHIAFHGISDADMYQLRIHSWSLTPPANTEVPSPVSDLQVAPAANGALNAVVAFTAPTTTVGGAALESLTKIEILCNGTVAETIENPIPGSLQSVTVPVPESGSYKFDVIPYNAEGAGAAVSATVFIGLVPTAVSDLQVTPAADGALTAVVSFTAPTTTLGDIPLDTISKIEILCDSVLAETIYNPVPGSSQSVTVTVPENGTYKFDVIPYAADGAGPAASASSYIGKDAPSYVVNIEGVDNKNGTATFTWAPYTEETGVHGLPLDLSTLKYNVYSTKENEDGGIEIGDLLQTVTDTVATIDCPNWNTGDFDFFYAVVVPVVSDVEGEENYGAIVIGAPEELPFFESTTTEGEDISINHDWWISSIAGSSNWGLTETSADDEGGGFAYQAASFGQDYAAALNTNKITLAGAEKPVLKFNYALQTGYFGGYADLYVAIELQDGTGYNFVLTASTDNEGFQESTWYEGVVDLSEFANEEYVIVSFIGASNDYGGTVYLDNINITDMAGIDDLSVELYAPSSVNAGSTLQAFALVENLGAEDVEAGAYSVNFYVNGELYKTITETDAMEALTGYAIYSVEYPVTLFDKEGVTIKTEVVYENDTDVENNADEGEIAVLVSNLPTVTDLSGVEEGGDVSLTWSAPEGGAELVTETFEEGNGGFTAIDADGDGFNWEYIQSERYKAQSGIGLWISASYDNDSGSALTPDEWLITPKALLDGTFSFYACGQDPDWADEHFAVFVSTTGNNPEDFTQVSEEYVATGDMTQYSVDLSGYNGAEGYIAIRHFNSTDMYVLNIDDVTFTRVLPGVTGYNVYRDGELIATVENTEYVDEGVADGEHAYFVSVLYEGSQESDLSNEFDITIGSWLPGDVNHDGEVDVNDVMAVVSHILGNEPTKFYATEANLNGDEEIDVNDVMAIVNIILNGGNTPAAAIMAKDKLVMTSNANGYNINLKASEVYTGCRMTIQLPEGCTLLDAKAANGVTVTANSLGDGVYRLVAFSQECKDINGEDALISLSVNGNCNDNASISEIYFTNPSFDLISFAPVENVTGIDELKAQTENAPAYNLQGVKAENLTRGVYVRDGKKFVVK